MFLERLDNLMKQRGINKNVLSRESGIPYTTIDGFYKKGCENTKLSTLMKLADYFGVTLDYLINGETEEKVGILLTTHQQKVINAYIAHPEMQAAVDKLLGVDAEEAVTIKSDIEKTVEGAAEILNKNTVQK